MTDRTTAETSRNENPVAEEKAAEAVFMSERPTDNDLSSEEKMYFATRGASGLVQEAEHRKQPTDETGRGHHKTVPHTVLDSEREQHEKMPAQFEEMRNKAQNWQRDLALLQESRHLSQASPPTMPPDPREDFLGFARWQGEEIARLNQELTVRQRQAEEENRAAAAEIALRKEWDHSVNELRREHSDIDTALEFLEATRLNQLGVLANVDARFADAAFCRKQIDAELRDIIIATFQQGINPAKAVYEIAKSYGYGCNETERLNKLQEAEKAARSLTAGAGKQAGDPFLLETVANMPEAEFAKWYAHNKSSFRQMFGG